MLCRLRTRQLRNETQTQCLHKPGIVFWDLRYPPCPFPGRGGTVSMIIKIWHVFATQKKRNKKDRKTEEAESEFFY